MNRRRVLAGGGAVALAGAGAAWLGFRGMGSIADYEAVVSATRAFLAVRAELADLVRFATLAPNGHNAQPWRFRLAEGRIDVLPDPTPRTRSWRQPRNRPHRGETRASVYAGRLQRATGHPPRLAPYLGKRPG